MSRHKFCTSHTNKYSKRFTSAQVSFVKNLGSVLTKTLDKENLVSQSKKESEHLTILRPNYK